MYIVITVAAMIMLIEVDLCMLIFFFFLLFHSKCALSFFRILFISYDEHIWQINGLLQTITVMF